MNMNNSNKHMLGELGSDIESMVDMIEGELKGAVIKERFVIGRLLDRGSFGKVYKIVDINDKHRPLVIKMSEEVQAFALEIKAMKKIFQYNEKTPEVVDYGLIVHQKQGKEMKMLSYMIMPRFGENLETFFEKSKRQLPLKMINQIG